MEQGGTYQTFGDTLVQRLPWIASEPEYQDLVVFWEADRPGPHIVFGDVFVPVLVRMLSCAHPDAARLREAFLLIEEIVRSPDERIAEVGVTTILEGLHGARAVRDKARLFLGPVSRRYAQRIEDDWGA